MEIVDIKLESYPNHLIDWQSKKIKIMSFNYPYKCECGCDIFYRTIYNNLFVCEKCKELHENYDYKK